MAFFALFLGFLLGGLAVLAAEGLALYLSIVRLRRRAAAAHQPPEEPLEPRDLDAEQWLASACSKQGIVWFLEPEKVPMVCSNESQMRGPKELKMKKGTMEVQPVKKYAKIKNHSLILSDPDGSQATIKLLDCTVLAVSASNLPSKKWAKRYPIRLESKVSTIYDGSKTCYMYLDSAWEKESWCKALRLASSQDNTLINWYGQLSKEFNHYLASFSAVFPSFFKPSALAGENIEKTIRIDASSSSSKVRVFLKKLAKKASKTGVENRANSVLSSTHDVRKTNEKLVLLNDTSSADGSVKCSLEDKSSSSSFQDLVQLSNKGLLPIMSDAICDDKFFGDNGTLCWNLLLSRLFFDAKRNSEINNFVKNRIQKTLSSMRTPSYIGGVTCSNLDLGNLPPYIHKIGVLPMDLTELWAVEIDIEYLGGLLLGIETRIEVCRPELQEEIINAGSEPNFNADASSFLEGIEYYRDQLQLSGNLADQLQKRGEWNEEDFLKQPKSQPQAAVFKSKWKTIVQTIAEQVSQVPLSLGIRIASLRGTLRLHVRPPPSDQLWFGFTSMPEIDWQLESSVGDRKITNSHIALLMGNRFKAAIRDNLVLPNCESICIPWMLAEKDDWVPQKVAPFIWNKQEGMDMVTPGVTLTSHSGDSKTKPNTSDGTKSGSACCPDDKTEKIKDVVYVQQAHDDHHISRSVSPQSQNDTLASISSSSAYHGDTISAYSHQSSPSSTSEELITPLLRTDGAQENSNHSRAEYSRASSSGIFPSVDEHASVSSEEDAKAKRIGRRARMMDLGKRMGEKLEEKRRHIEEKSRNIVEKIRENSRS